MNKFFIILICSIVVSISEMSTADQKTILSVQDCNDQCMDCKFNCLRIDNADARSRCESQCRTANSSCCAANGKEPICYSCCGCRN